MGQRKIHRVWGPLREEFISRRLRGEALSLAAFALERKVPLRSLERHSTSEGWFGEIERRAREQVQAIDQHSERVVLQVRGHLNVNETEVREEHAGLMRLLTDVALRKMETLNPDSLTVDQMITVLRFAPAEMRAALGMVDLPGRVSASAAAKAHFQRLVKERHESSRALEEFEQKVERRRRTSAALSELVRIVEAEGEQH